MTLRTGESLRRAALQALGPHSDERARDVLAGSTFSLVEGVTKWEASAGTVLGHRVVLALDAARLGTLRAAPRVTDELHVAIAAAVAQRPGEALSELAFRWSAAPAPQKAGYRDAPPTTALQGLREAVVEYAKAFDEREVAGLVARAELETSGAAPREVRVRGASADRELARRASVLSFVTRAVRDLLGDERIVVSLRCRP